MMSKTAQLQTIQIVSTPGVLGGKPRVEGRRVSVQQIAAYHERVGWRAEEIAAAFNLSLSEVYAALSYYHAHQDEIDAEIERDQAQLDALRRQQTTDTLDGVMTAAAVARTYDLSPRTVRDAIESGWIEARKSGGTWLVRRVDAEARWGDRRPQR